MAIADSRVPNGIGILPLQHEDYDKQGFSVDLRGSLVALRITGRDDGDQGLGQWFYDTNTPGTLEGGNFWDVDRNLRNCPGWAFAWSVQAETSGGASNDVATGPGRRRGGSQQARPTGQQGAPDGRYNPKPIFFPIRLGKAGADPNKAQPKAPPAPPGARPGNQDFGGPVLVLGIGGSIGGFGGQGVGTGSRFASFSGVRTNFSSGSPRAGATFSFIPPMKKAR
jgi:hypothetical protein